MLARCGGGAFDIDAAASVLQHNGLEAFAARVFGRIADAEVRGEAGQKDPRESALAQVAGKSGLGPAIVFIKGRVGIDAA